MHICSGANYPKLILASLVIYRCAWVDNSVFKRPSNKMWGKLNIYFEAYQVLHAHVYLKNMCQMGTFTN